MKTLLIILSAASILFCEGLRVGIMPESQTVVEYRFCTAANLYYAPTNNIIFGLRTAYNRWSPDADSFLNQLPIILTDGEINGSATLWRSFSLELALT